MARKPAQKSSEKPIENPEDAAPSQAVASGAADPAQTGDSLPQSPDNVQGAAVPADTAVPLELPPPGLEDNLMEFPAPFVPPLAAPDVDAPVVPVLGDHSPVLTIKGPAKGRWRAGRHFGPEAVRIATRDLTDAEISALAGDPELTVVVG